MPKRRTKINKVARRDADICGVHLGGCMKPIEDRMDRSRDHIMPRAFFLNPAFGADQRVMNDDWNLQVMHKSCNVNRGGFIHGLPCFQCPCHYYQVIGKDLYVYHRADQTPKAYLLMRDFVMPASDGRPNGLALRVEPVSENPTSWPKGGKLEISPSNTSIHYVVCINPSMVTLFNDREIQRADMLARYVKRSGKPQGPIPVVYLNQQDNINFNFGPITGVQRSNIAPFPFPRNGV